MKSVIVHAILAAGGLGLAWLTWTGGDVEERPEGEVELVDCEPGQVEALELETEDEHVRLEARGDGDWWVTVTRQRPADDGETEEETREFAGADEAVTEYLDQVAPLRALRSLGELGEETLKELELAEEPDALVLTCGGETHRFFVGGSAFGSGDRYLRKTDGGATYLLDAGVVRSLESAELRLMQRELVGVESADVASAVVKVAEEEQELLHRNRTDRQRAQWVSADAPDRRNELYGNWLDLVGQLRIQHYLSPDASPGSDLEDASATPVPVAEITWRDEDGERLEHLELVRVDALGGRYYARTDATGAWVAVTSSIGRRVEDDARPVVGLEPIAREEPEPEPNESGATEAVEEPADGALGDGEPAEGPPGASPSPHGVSPHGASPHGAQPPATDPHGGADHGHAH